MDALCSCVRSYVHTYMCVCGVHDREPTHTIPELPALINEVCDVNIELYKLHVCSCYIHITRASKQQCSAWLCYGDNAGILVLFVHACMLTWKSFHGIKELLNLPLLVLKARIIYEINLAHKNCIYTCNTGCLCCSTI